MSQASSKSAKTSSSEASQIKETIESILVAFILAFIFRAFVVEAFVIPTGSMATTLLGAHFHFVCPDCGYTFDVNFPTDDREGGDDLKISDVGNPSGDVYCPNCGYQIKTTRDTLPTHFGDRILVLKYIYLVHAPRRWDVVVFKSPYEADQYHYTVNYIKRLAGLPGEKLMVLDGDLYTAAPVTPATPDGWQIQSKPPSAQEAMWRLVYDNDFQPQNLPRDQQGLAAWQQPWKPEAGQGWNTGGRAFQFNNAGGTGTLKFDPNANPTSQTLSDYLIYDAGATAGCPYSTRTAYNLNDDRVYPINDVKLAAYYQRTAGEGSLRLMLSRFEKKDHVFTAEISRDRVLLWHETDGVRTKIAEAALADLGISPGQKIYAEFMDVDYQVTLRLNGRDAFAPYDYTPDVKWLLEQWHLDRRHRTAEARIEAENQTCTLDHIGLWRDVYYTDHVQPRDGEANATPDHPIQLGPTEYFVLGDNSAVSADGRYWTQGIDLPHEGLEGVGPGRVPAQFMLGQAVFVYWPAGFSPGGTHIPIVPNFGEMRWIH